MVPEKKTEPYYANEFKFEDFYDFKRLSSTPGINSIRFRITEVKILKITMELPDTLFYKTTYSEVDFKELKIIQESKPFLKIIPLGEYPNKPILNEKKKNDLLSLVSQNLISKMYKSVRILVRMTC